MKTKEAIKKQRILRAFFSHTVWPVERNVVFGYPNYDLRMKKNEKGRHAGYAAASKVLKLAPLLQKRVR